MMRRVLSLNLAMLFLANAAIAEAQQAAERVKAEGKPSQESKSVQKASSTPTERYQGLVKEIDQAQQAFFSEYRTAKSDEERRKLVQELYPNPRKYAARFMKLATDHRNDSAAVDALVWIISSVRYGDDVARALEILSADHIESEKLTRVCQSMMYTASADSTAFLRNVMEKNPHHDVCGWACYSLGKGLLRPRRSKQDGDTGEAEQLLERVVKEFADVKSYRGTLADMAEGDLFELRNLAIGCVAPDIEGEDIDGVSFRLTDYRGKVVVLDFWGNW